MTCACGSGEYDKHLLSDCVKAMAKRLAALEVKSAVPPQPDLNRQKVQAVFDGAHERIDGWAAAAVGVATPPKPQHSCPSCDYDDGPPVPGGRLIKSTPLHKPEAQPAPVTSEQARSALDVIDEPAAHRELRFTAKVALIRFINEQADAISEREAREAELLAELERANNNGNVWHKACERAWLRMEDAAKERDTLRAELAAERAKSAELEAANRALHVELARAHAKSAVPAPGGTNRADGYREKARSIATDYMGHTFGGCSQEAINAAKAGYLAKHIEMLAVDVARDAESRGRNAAHGEAVKAWAALGDSNRLIAWGAMSNAAREHADAGSGSYARIIDIARAALAELAGTEGT